MEGLNIAIIAGTVTAVRIVPKSNKGIHRRICIKRKGYYKSSDYRGNLTVVNCTNYIFADCFGFSVPCGTNVCFPCEVVGGKDPEAPTVFLHALGRYKCEQIDASGTNCFAWITGEVVELRDKKRYTGVTLKADNRYLRLFISKEAGVLEVGDYIFANCIINTDGDGYMEDIKISLFANNYINISKDAILGGLDNLKELVSSTLATETLRQ